MKQLSAASNALVEHFEEVKKETIVDTSSFDDLTKRVDRARELIEYKKSLEKRLKWFKSNDIYCATLSLNEDVRLFSHSNQEDRLLDTFKFVFEKSIEMELEKIGTELNSLNVGL